MAKKILLIEHDADVQNIIRYILEDEGYTVSSMESPDDLALIVHQQPDLVLIDEWLAVQPGHRLCLRIKEFELLNHVPVIILSTAPHIEEIMAECHADAFVRKPFDLNELLEKVRMQLGSRS